MNKYSIKGFNLAFDDMVNNLDKELDRFKDRIKDGQTNIKIKHSEQYTPGAGSFSLHTSIILFLFFILLSTRKCRNQCWANY